MRVDWTYSMSYVIQANTTKADLNGDILSNIKAKFDMTFDVLIDNANDSKFETLKQCCQQIKLLNSLYAVNYAILDHKTLYLFAMLDKLIYLLPFCPLHSIEIIINN